MDGEWIEEATWSCRDCGSKGILGRHKECPNCASPREKSEMDVGGYDQYAAPAPVTNPDLIDLFTAGADWFCTHCGSGNRGDARSCKGCGSPRYGESKENHPSPEFANDHVGKAGTVMDGADEIDGSDAGCDHPDYQPKVKPARPEPKFEDPEPVAPSSDFSGLLPKVLGGLAAVALLAFGVWAMQTHPVTGVVSSMTWERAIKVEEWTQTRTEGWRHQTYERAEVPPVNGTGERAGMVLLSCRDRQFDTEQYQDGTKPESYDCSTYKSVPDTCYRDKEVPDGKVCRDNGNVSRTCRKNTKTVQDPYPCTKRVKEPKSCTRQVPNMKTRPVYKPWCTYATQKWQSVRIDSLSGSGHTAKWPDTNLTSLQRGIKMEDYKFSVSYVDRGKSDQFSRSLSAGEYATRNVGDKVVLHANNLGGISSYE